MILTLLIASLTYSSSHAVTIPDGNLAAAVREALGLGATDPIPQTALEELEHLDAKEKGIKDLTGLKKATGLKILELQKNQIQDITPLADLTNLVELHLTDNQIERHRSTR